MGIMFMFMTLLSSIKRSEVQLPSRKWKFLIVLNAVSQIKLDSQIQFLPTCFRALHWTR